jgi:sarcosine oxidase subunit beta
MVKMINRADVVIIGGGVQGCSIAYNLAKYGCKRVVVFEKGYLTSGSTGRCAGGVRQQFGTEMNCVLARESVRLFKTLSQELDYDIEFEQWGYLLLAYSKKELDQFKKNVALQQGFGIEARLIAPNEVKEIVSPINLHGIMGATYCPTDGHANPFKTTFAYAEAAEKLGVKIYTFTKVRGIQTKNNKIVSVETNRGRISTPVVVNAAGPYSGNVGAMVGIDLPVYSKRQQFLVTEPLDHLFKPFLIAFSRQVSCQQTPHGSILMGGGDPKEPESFNIRSSWQYAREFSRKIIDILPDLRTASIVRQWAGLYNITPDAQPILGAHPQVSGFYMAIGFSGHGFMLAPIVGQLIAELILEGGTSLPIHRIDIGRFERGELMCEPSVI